MANDAPSVKLVVSTWGVKWPDRKVFEVPGETTLEEITTAIEEVEATYDDTGGRMTPTPVRMKFVLCDSDPNIGT